MYVLFDGKTGIDLFLAEKKLNEIIVTCRLPSLKEFKDPADTLEHRKKEIVNSFFLAREKRINNGPVKSRRLFDQEDISDQQQPFLLRKIPLPPAVFSGQKQPAWFRTLKEFRRTTEANEKRPASALLRRIRISCFLSFGNETRRQLKLLSPQGSEHYPLFGIKPVLNRLFLRLSPHQAIPKK